MNELANQATVRRPARWSLVLAFALVYLSWGTTYLAIQKGVEAFPPALFGGSRVMLAGLILLAYLALRGQPLRLPPGELLWTALVGVLLFVGGNGLITVAEQSVPSGMTSILAATTPLWMALLDLFGSWRERLHLRGWLGLLTGLAGVFLLLAPRLGSPEALLHEAGPFLVLASAFSWSVASVIVRSRRLRVAHLAAAAYQMVIGGGSLFLIGLVLGESSQLARERFTPVAVYAYFHLLVVSSLIGFVAYNWLLGHASAAMAGTYAYVNPIVAIVVGWLLNDEAITPQIVGSMAIILTGVALVGIGRGRAKREMSSASAQGAEKTPQHP